MAGVLPKTENGRERPSNGRIAAMKNLDLKSFVDPCVAGALFGGIGGASGNIAFGLLFGGLIAGLLTAVSQSAKDSARR